MLISFGAKNFCCFKEWLEIDLKLKGGTTPDFNNENRFSKVTALFGANASGKTNALKALSFLGYFCSHSFAMKPDEEIPIDTFFNNEEKTDFYIDFVLKNIEYSYELSLVKTKILEEKISRKDKRETIVFHRIGNIIESNTLFRKEDVVLRSNASVISTSNQYEIPEMAEIYLFFNQIISNVKYKGLKTNLFDLTFLSQYYKKNENSFVFAKDLIAKFDTGISDISIESFQNDQDKKIFYPVFHHDATVGKMKLSFESQSSGTQRLFHNLISYHSVLSAGGVLALDEFDINLHPEILPHLLSLFENTETNPKNAQLLFSTHNTDFMDNIGKYRIYIFTKRNGESFCYRGDEIPDVALRNDRSISKIYRTGKIGGVPRI